MGVGPPEVCPEPSADIEVAVAESLALSPGLPVCQSWGLEWLP